MEQYLQEFKKAPSDEIMNNFYFIHSYHNSNKSNRNSVGKL